MIAFVCFVSFVFVSGYLFGACIGLPYWPRRIKPAQPIPIAWALNIAETNRPAVYRRKSKRIIDVE